MAPGLGRSGTGPLYVDLFQVMCITPMIFAGSIGLGEILIAEQRFLFYGLAPVLYNLGIRVTTALSRSPASLGIFAAAIRAVLGTLLHLGIRLLGPRKRTTSDWSPISKKNQHVREIIQLMLPKNNDHPIGPRCSCSSRPWQPSRGSLSSMGSAQNLRASPVSPDQGLILARSLPELAATSLPAIGRASSRCSRRTLATIGVLSVSCTAAVRLFFE